jgi:DNA-directed RNA polymerase specialized sigma24 family protein
MDSGAAVPWETLLVGYLSGTSDFDLLYRTAYKPFLRIVAQIGNFLPEDVREEAVDEAFVRLIANPPQYDPSKCRPRTFVYGLLRNAVRHVRAIYAQPGKRTRTVRKLSANGKQQTAGPLEVDRQEIAEDTSIPDLEAIPSRRWTPDSVHAGVEARLLLRQLPRDLAFAVFLVDGLERSVVEAAGMLRKSRFAIARSVRQARNQARLLAA